VSSEVKTVPRKVVSFTRYDVVFASFPLTGILPCY